MIPLRLQPRIHGNLLPHGRVPRGPIEFVLQAIDTGREFADHTLHQHLILGVLLDRAVFVGFELDDVFDRSL